MWLSAMRSSLRVKGSIMMRANPAAQLLELEMAHDLVNAGIPIVVVPCLSENDRLIAMTIRLKKLTELEAAAKKVNEPD